jgi:hypothetical protein
LPDPWVLLQPWILESNTLPTIQARLLDLDTHETIELPIGRSGWS